MAKRTASAKKQARAGVKRSARNRAVRSEVKTKVVKARRSYAESPVAESDRASLTVEAIRSLDRAAAVPRSHFSVDEGDALSPQQGLGAQLGDVSFAEEVRFARQKHDAGSVE